MTIQLRTILLIALILILGAYGPFLCTQESEQLSQEATSGLDRDNGLRGVFLGKDAEPAQSQRVVGRLAILLKTEDGTKRVRPDYAFHSGDRFRFEISANQDGWLYVMHADSGSNWRELWPTKPDVMKVRAEQSYEIPPSPGVFIFDKETGTEFFYVVIRRDATRPTFMSSASPAKQSKISVGKSETPINTPIPATATPAGKVINFLVRDPFGETTRGVVFDPGKDDVDPYLYFSSTPEDVSKSAKVRFQLHHVD